MRTLVFCTSYAAVPEDWERRHAWWLKSLRQSDIECDQILIVDDGSPCLPQWKEVDIVRQADAPEPLDLLSTAPVVLYTHTERWGRTHVFDFPGWYRSFAFAARYAEARGFQKVIHLESDAFLISPRIRRYFNDFAEGWAALWSDRYTFPELAIQVAAGREVATMAAFTSEPYDRLRGRLHETAFPYTHVETLFCGDRYGEIGAPVPKHADFVAQAAPGETADYYWWIGQGSSKAKRRGLSSLGVEEHVQRYDPPFTETHSEGGWSHIEPGVRWMTETDSRLFLPPVEVVSEHRLDFEVRPAPGGTDGRRFYVLVNDRLVIACILHRSITLSCVVSADALNTDRPNYLRFVHPDVCVPSGEDPAVQDLRQLSVGLRRITVTSIPTEAAVVETRPVKKRFLWG